MGLKPIDKQDVWVTIAHLEKMGQAASANKVREQIGRGSLSTISKYVKEWNEKEAALNSKSLEQLLTDVDIHVVSDYFKKEHPQITALMITYLNSKDAAIVLKTFTSEQQEDILQRVENIKAVKKEIVQLLSDSIREEFSKVVRDEFFHIRGKEFADIIREEMQ